MSYFNIVAQSTESTVVTEYEAVKSRSSQYQSEAALEKEFIHMLTEQGYTYLTIHHEKDLIANLRIQLENLNNYQFSDNEWEKFFKSHIANNNQGIVEKTRKIQEDYIQVLKRDDGTSKNISLIDKKNVHNNSLQVINQYVLGISDGAKHDNRYDVTILVNGFPLVHVELKRRGVAIREAFNQINRYQRDSFWAGSGLFEYIQIFVISNGTNTKYYSNSTRFNAIKDSKNSTSKKGKTSNSFEFTSFWADANNRIIPDLIDFTRTFFAKHTILNIITKYCIFTSENMLLVMRPYQITATERILNRIEIANNYKKYGNVAGGGYIWHTTGSGKTLTSFKTARLASQLPYIDKVLFVVDRKDLDYQTMKEYDRFEKGAANSNTSTAILKKQLEDSDAHIIITTIQKLATFIKKNKNHDVYDKHVVIIFDECHRSQFGDMHKIIIKKFNNRGENINDIFQIGVVGLIKAIDNFDITQPVQFSTYAVPMIIGEIRRYLRDNNPIRVSRSLKDIAYKALQVRERLIRTNSKEPTISEIAKELDMEVESVVMALDAIQDPISLFDPVYQDNGDAIFVMDQVQDKKDTDENWLEEIALKEAIKKLSSREKLVLDLRFYKGRTQIEVADEIGISQAQVSRIEKNALKNMRKYI